MHGDVDALRVIANGSQVGVVVLEEVEVEPLGCTFCPYVRALYTLYIAPTSTRKPGQVGH